jgi:hypothetical protein
MTMGDGPMVLDIAGWMAFKCPNSTEYDAELKGFAVGKKSLRQASVNEPGIYHRRTEAPWRCRD